jgi:hypothetical protein
MRKTLFVLSVVFLVSCQTKKELTRVWIFKTADYPEESKQLDFNDDEFNYLRFSLESFLNIEKNGKYTTYFGKYQQGEWQKKDDDLLLSFPGNKALVFQVKKIDDDELQLYYKPRGALYTFKGYPADFASELENPFSYSNNKWREKALGPESDAEINERLRNYCRFYEKYFAWGDKIKTSTLDVNNVPGPLTIYSNGFELIHYTQQPYEWQSHFYDSNEVKKAYMKIYHIFRTSDLDWNREQGNYKMFESAFRQLENKIQ